MTLSSYGDLGASRWMPYIVMRGSFTALSGEAVLIDNRASCARSSSETVALGDVGLAPKSARSSDAFSTFLRLDGEASGASSAYSS